MDIFQSIILGIVEGLTEFLPISSTGHMILAGHFLGINQEESFVKTFEIAIQLGSILAVVFMFYKKLIHKIDIWIKLLVSFVPTGIIGFIAYKYIKQLFAPQVTAYMLIIGGLIFLWIEWREKNQKVVKKVGLDSISYKEAFIVGLCQSFAMVPGVSRSGATIVAGLLSGFSRTLAAEFSFLLAIPTMFAATGYDLYKNFDLLSASNTTLLLIGGCVAFLVGLLSIKVFLSFISRFSYVPFGIYRIFVGVVFLAYYWKIYA